MAPALQPQRATPTRPGPPIQRSTQCATPRTPRGPRMEWGERGWEPSEPVGRPEAVRALQISNRAMCVAR